MIVVNNDQVTEISQKNIATLEQRIKDAITQAHGTCSINGQQSTECVVAWDIVEELSAEKSHQKHHQQNSLEKYCDNNPYAVECRVYEV